MKKKISIVGGGTSALFFAAFIDTNKYDVTIYEKQKTLGRKFLVAGDGGFNLTHSEDISELVKRYTPDDFLKKALYQFTNMDMVNWLGTIGIPTFVGSSKRVFPQKGIKPIQVLEVIKSTLKSRGVKFEFNKTFTNWGAGNNLVMNKDERVKSDINIFALGGASWKVTGSDGLWTEPFENKNITIKPFVAQNCSFHIDWERAFIEKNEGLPLKNIAISYDGHTQKGEVVITRFGLEGNAIYGLSPHIQNELLSQKSCCVFIDFKPTVSKEVLLKKYAGSTLNVTQTLKRVVKLSSTQLDLIKTYVSKDNYLKPNILIDHIKAFPLTINACGPIDEAISTSGGIDRLSLNNNFELKSVSDNYCIGEMVDWSAPTGGYLIQGCASMGVSLARHLNDNSNDS